MIARWLPVGPPLPRGTPSRAASQHRLHAHRVGLDQRHARCRRAMSRFGQRRHPGMVVGDLDADGVHVGWPPWLRRPGEQLQRDVPGRWRCRGSTGRSTPGPTACRSWSCCDSRSACRRSAGRGTTAPFWSDGRCPPGRSVTGRRGGHVVLDLLEDQAVGSRVVAGLRRDQRRISRRVPDREQRVEHERELKEAHHHGHEDREDQGELDKRIWPRDPRPRADGRRRVQSACPSPDLGSFPGASTGFARRGPECRTANCSNHLADGARTHSRSTGSVLAASAAYQSP